LIQYNQTNEYFYTTAGCVGFTNILYQASKEVVMGTVFLDVAMSLDGYVSTEQ